jgi:anti-anti-sigma factor
MDPGEIGFAVEVGGGRDGTVVAPRGELDVATQAELRAALERQAEHGAVTLDLSGLRFMDTSGLRLILETAEASRRGEFAFAVLPGAPVVQRLFEVAGVMELVPFRDGEEGGAS